MDTISSMGLPPDIVGFMHNILGLCDGAAYKAVAVQASSTDTELKPLSCGPSCGPSVGPLPAKTSL